MLVLNIINENEIIFDGQRYLGFDPFSLLDYSFEFPEIWFFPPFYRNAEDLTELRNYSELEVKLHNSNEFKGFYKYVKNENAIRVRLELNADTYMRRIVDGFVHEESMEDYRWTNATSNVFVDSLLIRYNKTTELLKKLEKEGWSVIYDYKLGCGKRPDVLKFSEINSFHVSNNQLANKLRNFFKNKNVNY